MFDGKNATSLAVFLAIALAGLSSLGQNIGQSRAVAGSDPVQYLFPEQVSLPAGKPAAVNLHFRVAPGLHINSHTPNEDYLIPTTFSIPDGTGVRLDGVSYPAGVALALPVDPKTKLSVYTGEFVLQARIVSPSGNHLVEAKLRYQACNSTQCLPPKTITVPIDVIGK